LLLGLGSLFVPPSRTRKAKILIRGLLSVRSRKLTALITVPVIRRFAGRSRRAKGDDNPLVRLPAIIAVIAQVQPDRQPYRHRPSFARHLTRLLDGNNARVHPASRDIAQA